MTLRTKRHVLFGVVFVVWLVLDLWSKHWADTTLANYIHPIPVQVTAQEAGQPLREVLKDRFGWDDAEADRRIFSQVEKLAPAGGYTADAKPFASQQNGFYVFWRGDHATPPRRIDQRERATIPRWLSLALPKMDPTERAQLGRELINSWTFAGWLEQRFHKLDAELVGAIAADLIHPVNTGSRRLSGDETVAEGEYYLLLKNEVAVAGEWFKFRYAENPGAAFSFMRGVSPSVRLPLFGLLTLIAFVVIGMIVWRLPPEGWWVRISFAAILAGAAGNFVDRIRFGYVIDFIDVDLGFYHWPTFNVADIAITVGVAALVIDILFNKNSALASKKDDEKKDGGKKAAKKAAAKV